MTIEEAIATAIQYEKRVVQVYQDAVRTSQDEIGKKIADKVEKKRSLEIAKVLKKQKVSEKIIAENTGLTVEEIRAIEV